ncbi:MAG: dihydroneopterin aldolase, partial [Muribaculaceae bacterium]|nr:dihydroneopterin aldolase [Muribaculaceae bacterium]
MKTFRIYLKNLRFFSKIGVFQYERTIGNEFQVNVAVEISAENFVSESLDTTISYADLYDIVKS